MGYRQYLHISDSVASGADLLAGRGALKRLREALEDLSAELPAMAPSFSNIVDDLRSFERLASSSRSIRCEVSFADWLTAVRHVAVLLREPPWELRKTYGQSAGPIEGLGWIIELADTLELYRDSTVVLFLDAHD